MRLARLYDRLYSGHNRHRLERVVAWASIAGFLAHLAHVALARHLPHPPAIVAAAGENYLSAIYTPFSLILFYEVLILIAAIPLSTTQSMALQFEIVSLIFIRGFFKDIAKIDLDALHVREMLPAFAGAGAGLAMFLLVGVFRWLARSHPPAPPALELARFIGRKKAISLVLTVIFVAMGAWAAAGFVKDALSIITTGSGSLLASKPAFYTEMFTVMIFTDVLILILSLMVSDRYELVFRNAAFVIATILIRFALTAEFPYGAEIALAGMAFGIFTLAVYNYNSSLSKSSD